MKRIRLLLLCLLLLLGLAGCGETEQVLYYCADGAVYQVTPEGTEVLDWDGSCGEAEFACWDGKTLCVSAQDQADGTNSLWVYDQAEKTWTALDCPGTIHLWRIQLCGDYAYVLSDVQEGTMARIRLDGTGQEALPVTHLFLYPFSVTEDTLYALDLSEAGDQLVLTTLDLATMEAQSVSIDPPAGYRPRFSGQYLYLIPDDTATGELSMQRADLSGGDLEELAWEALPILEGVSAEDYGQWSYTLVQCYGEKVLYETPEGQLLLYDEGKTGLLWDLPVQTSANFEPLYFFSEAGAAVVYTKDYGADSAPVQTVFWSDIQLS